MHIEAIRDFCLSMKGVDEGFPFDEDTLVFKVLGKMFLLVSLSEPESINLKCEPQYAVQLREQYSDVQPGYHMNKKHWNTVCINGDLSDQLVYDLIVHSYDEVVKSMPKKTQLLLTSQ